MTGFFLVALAIFLIVVFSETTFKVSYDVSKLNTVAKKEIEKELKIIIDKLELDAENREKEFLLKLDNLATKKVKEQLLILDTKFEAFRKEIQTSLNKIKEKVERSETDLARFKELTDSTQKNCFKQLYEIRMQINEDREEIDQLIAYVSEDSIKEDKIKKALAILG